MVQIPAPGRFLIGISRGEEDRFKVPDTERRRSEPVTEVFIEYAFAVGRHEVTRGQFAAFVRESGYEAAGSQGCWDGYGRPEQVDPADARRKTGRNSLRAEYNWQNPGFAQDDSHPVVCLNEADIWAYMAWLSKKSAKKYRLLSESEFEYLVREGGSAAWPWGSEPNGACLNANVSDLTRADVDRLDRANDNVFQCYDGFAHTAPVGSFKPNKLGIHDLIGNVWEITADCYGSLADVPRDGAPAMKSECTDFVSRGGSWDIFPYATRSGYRSRFDPKSRFSYHGFRVAVTLGQAPRPSRRQ